MKQKEENNQESVHIRSMGMTFAISVTMILLIGMGLVSVLQYRTVLSNAANQLQRSGQSMANLLAEFSVEAILGYDYVQIDGFVNDSIKQENIVYVAILGNDSNTVAFQVNKEQLHRLDSLHRGDLSILVKLQSMKDIMHVKAFIQHRNNILGTVLIGLDRTHLKQIVYGDFILQFIATGFVIMLAGLIIYIFFRMWVFRRIKDLAEVARAVTLFDFDKHIKVRGNDELSLVGKLFNRMTNQIEMAIEQRDKAISESLEFNQTLEKRVEERSHELQLANTKLAHQAMHDPLTNLPNRILVSDRLSSAIINARRNKEHIAVFMIDLNKFKEINDTLGHHIGDLFLKEVSERFPQSLREGDTVARIGGDEFIIILLNTGFDGAKSIIKKINIQLNKPIIIDDIRLPVSASMGISIFPEHGEDDKTLIQRADIAMYDAKSSNETSAFYNPAKDTHSRDRLALMADLRDAIESDELLLFYQPVIDLSDPKVRNAEALTRWKHNTLGWVDPTEFISLAEHSGLIKPFTEWVMHAACKQSREWLNKGIYINIAINLSARNLLDPDLPVLFKKLMSEYNLKENTFKFEITESTLMSNPDRAMEIMTCPEFYDVDYSIDDFGTGYSSLSYLKKLPVQYVKIDRSFVHDMVRDQDDRSIVKSTIELAHSLDLKVIAEGVEDKVVSDELVAMGCDFAQGNYYSKAVPKEEFVSVIKAIEEGKTNVDRKTNVIDLKKY